MRHRPINKDTLAHKCRCNDEETALGFSFGAAPVMGVEAHCFVARRASEAVQLEGLSATLVMGSACSDGKPGMGHHRA